MKKLTTTQKVLIAGGALAAGVVAYKKFGSMENSATNQIAEIIPPFQHSDPKGQENYDIIRTALNQGGTFIRGNDTIDAAKFEQLRQAFNAKHGKDYNARQYATTMAVHAAQNNIPVIPASTIAGMGNAQNLLS